MFGTEHHKVPQHIGLAVAFFGGIIAILAMQDGARISAPTATTIIHTPPPVGTEAPPPADIPPATPIPKNILCESNDDCPVASTVCSEQGRCVPLKNPTCTCSQPNVLRCKEDGTGRARHVHCKGGCVLSEMGVECLG